MGKLGVLSAAGLLAWGLAACGGGTGPGHRTGPAGAPGSSPAVAVRTTPGTKPPAAYAGRLLRDNELPGFLITDASVYSTPAAFVSSEGLSSGQAVAELHMLSRNGLRVAVKEDLDKRGLAGLSLVEQFASPAAARSAMAFYLARFRAPGQATQYEAFRVAGPPGAVGFVLGDPGGTGINLAFTGGDSYYLVAQVGSGAAAQESLVRAARSLYSRAAG